MNLKKILLILFIWTISYSTNAQTSHFSKQYGTADYNESAYFIKEISSGGYLLFGNSIDTLNFDDRYWGIIRIKNNGDTIFTKKIYTGKTAGGFFVEEESDGKLIIGAINGTDKFLHLLKVDTNYNSITEVKIDIKAIDTMQGIVSYSYKYLPGEGILIWGHNNFTGNSILKTDLNGKLIWCKSYLDSIPVSNINYLSVTDSGYLLSGNFSIQSRKQSDAYSILVDTGGNILKQTFANDPFQYNQKIFCVAHLNDGNFIEAGTQYSPKDAGYNKIFKL